MAYETYLTTNYGTNLQGYWPLHNDADDDSGTGNNGTVEGTGPTYGQTGIPGSSYNAARFASGGIRCEPRPATLYPLASADFTIIAFFKRLGAGTDVNSGNGGYLDIEPIVCKGMAQAEGDGENANYMVGSRVLTTRKICCDMEEHSTGVVGPTGQNHPVTCNTTITNSEWHMVAVTYDTSVASGTWAIYLDNVLQTADDGTMNPGEPPDFVSQQPFCIGGAMRTDQATWYGAFNGDICHVSMHDTALSSTAIQNLYQEAFPPTPSATLITPATTSALTGQTIVIDLDDDVGIDDDTVSFADVIVKRGGVALTYNLDYTFSYNPTTDRITLQAKPTGTNFPVGDYEVILNEGS